MATIGFWALMLAAGLFGMNRLTLRTSNLDLVSEKEPTVADFLEFGSLFGAPNAIFLVLQCDQSSTLEDTIDELGREIRHMPGVKAVLERLPLDDNRLEQLGLDPYFLSDDGQTAVIFIQPSDAQTRTTVIAPLVHQLRVLIQRPQWQNRDVELGLTGIPIYAVDDQEVIQRDVLRITVWGLLLVIMGFLAAFKQWRQPLTAIAVLVVSLTVAGGIAALLVGHLTLLSAVFLSLICGLGIDTSIHLISHLNGRNAKFDIAHTADEIGPASLMGMITTITAFASLLISGFKGFQELGMLCIVGLVITFLATWTLLPALLTLQSNKPDPPPEWRPPLIQRKSLAIIVTVLASLTLIRGIPSFDVDYTKLQPRDSAAIRWERIMTAETPFSIQFAGFIASDDQQERAMVQQLESVDGVGAVMALSVLGPELWPAWLVNMFRSKDGRSAVLVFADSNLWNTVNRQHFLRELQRIDPQVTGMPILSEFMLEKTRSALLRSLLWTWLALPVVITLSSRCPKFVVAALIPTALTCLALPGVMRLMGWHFNPINVLALPLVLGIAVDDGIYVTHAMVTRQRSLAETAKELSTGIALTSWTNICAFGILAFAHHRGLRSFGLVLATGVLIAYVVTVTVLPVWLGRYASQDKV